MRDLHLFAKKLIESERALVLPHDLGEIRSVAVDTAFGARPDVLLVYESETVAVEIWVSHQVDADKVKLYATHHQAALEIDLRPYRFVDEADWPRVILETADRWWIYPPIAVRQERERKRQELIERFRIRRDEAIAAMELAGELHVAEQKRLRATKDPAAIRRQTQDVDRALAHWRDLLAQADYQQELLKQAEERSRTAELRQAIEARRLRERAPPDLQALVTAFGSFPAITDEAWRHFDTENERYRRAMIHGDAYQDQHRIARAEQQSGTASREA